MQQDYRNFLQGEERPGREVLEGMEHDGIAGQSIGKTGNSRVFSP
jgi:hypothetical protein